jgi:hypothetical protein
MRWILCWIALIGCVVLMTLANAHVLLSTESHPLFRNELHSSKVPQRNTMRDFSSLVKRIASQDGKLILTSTSHAYLDITLNFMHNLDHFALAQHVLIICEDLAVYDELALYRWGGQVVLSNYGTLVEKGAPVKYGEKGYGNLTRTRPTYIKQVLLENVSAIWSDQDVFYVRNIFDVVRELEKDFDLIGITENREMGLCSGMEWFRASSNMISLLKYWEKRMQGKRDGRNQKVFREVVQAFQNQGRARVHILDEHHACSGKIYWDERSCDSKQAILIHNNWILGHDYKVIRAKCSKMWLLPCSLTISSKDSIYGKVRCDQKNSISSSLVSEIHDKHQLDSCPILQSNVTDLDGFLMLQQRKAERKAKIKQNPESPSKT